MPAILARPGPRIGPVGFGIISEGTLFSKRLGSREQEREVSGSIQTNCARSWCRTLLFIRATAAQSARPEDHDEEDAYLLARGCDDRRRLGRDDDGCIRPVAGTGWRLARRMEGWRMGIRGGNPAGRVRGSRNALSEEVICALLRDFRQHGQKAIA